ncbi:MAG: FAD:protein FMN transferase [Halioglobus sp.]
MITRKFESRFRVFGQACHLVLNIENDNSGEILGASEQEFRRIEAKFDSFDPQSLVGLINTRAGSGEFTPLDPESLSLFQYAEALWDQSKHIYDPTSYLIQRYYAKGRNKSAHRSGLKDDLTRVGWQNIEIGEQGARLAIPGMQLNLNSCIRPYAVDCVRKLLLKYGVKNALIDLDKDVATIGKQGDGANWLVGVRYPDGSRTAIERFKLNNKAYAIRGNFENALQIDGERFSRALSPIDGQPIPGLLGVAVIADTCLTASGAASVARMKTQNNALKWLDELGLHWLAIDRNFKCHGPVLGNAR